LAPISSKEFDGDCAECAAEYDEDAAKWMNKVRKYRAKTPLPDWRPTEELREWLKR
jgi:hypothetical protein